MELLYEVKKEQILKKQILNEKEVSMMIIHYTYFLGLYKII